MNVTRLLFALNLFLFALHVNGAPLVEGGRLATADSLLAAFDGSVGTVRLEAANAFLRDVYADGLLDEPLVFNGTEAADSIEKEVWYWAAEYYYGRHQYKQAEEYGLKALPLCVAGADRSLESDCLSILSLICERLGHFQDAAGFAKRCNELDLQTGDADIISSSYNTLAGIYMSANQPDEAEKYILKALDYSRQADNPRRRAVLLGMASEIYHKLGQDEDALDYATQAYDLDREGGRTDKAAIRQAQRASALIALRRDAAAMEALAEAIPGLRASGNSHSLGIALNQMGLLLHRQTNDSAAVRHFSEALEIFTAQHDIYNESHTRKGLYEALRATDPATAMAHIDRYNELKDSLYDHETGELLTKYAAQYDYSQLQERADTEHSLRMRLLRWGAALLALIILSVLFLLWQERRRQRHMKRLTQEIAELKGAIATIDKKGAGESLSREASAGTAGRDDGDKASGAADLEMADATTVSSGLTAVDLLFLQRVVEVVNEGLLLRRYDTETIASQLNMSKSTFQRRLQGITGETPKSFISAIQMQKATTLLSEAPDMPINEVARACGFDEPANFSRAFKRFFGVSPKHYDEK